MGIYRCVAIAGEKVQFFRIGANRQRIVLFRPLVTDTRNKPVSASEPPRYRGYAAQLYWLNLNNDQAGREGSPRFEARKMLERDTSAGLEDNTLATWHYLESRTTARIIPRPPSSRVFPRTSREPREKCHYRTTDDKDLRDFFILQTRGFI